MLRILQKLISRVKHNLSVPSHSLATEATFKTEPYRLHLLDTSPSSQSTITKDEALKYYHQMVAIRKMETKVNNMYKSKEVRGFCHLYSGQEAVAVGLHSAMRAEDSVITSYRCHGWVYLLTKTDPLVKVMAELLGTSLGCSRGMGGSMHMYAPNFYGGNGIVGAQVPLGVGIALTHKYNNKNAVCMTLYGDGAANNGQVFEVLNMAKLWNMPCIFVCENNHYGMGTSVPRSSANPKFYTRGEVIPGLWADGMDFCTMREAGKFAVEHCTSGKGPIILEAHTYRYYGHSLSDPGTSYRTRDEVAQMRKNRDPIIMFKEHILAAGLVSENELKTIDGEVVAEITKATAVVSKDKEVGLEELTQNVYANDKMSKEVRLVSPFKAGVHKSVPRTQS